MERAKAYLAGGIGLLVASIATVLWIIDGSIIFVLLHLLGLVIVFEVVILGTDVGRTLATPVGHLLYLGKIFLLGCLVGTAFFDLAGVYIFEVWSYPGNAPLSSPITYLLTITPAWGLYFVLFHQSYRILHDQFHGHDTATISLDTATTSWIALAGVLFLMVGAGIPRLFGEPFIAATIAALGSWILIEGLELQQTEPTLLEDLVSGNLSQVAAIFGGSVILGLISEYTNLIAATQHWRYYHIPLEQVSIAGVPFTLLFSWAWMYILFLSIENMLIPETSDLWN